jgi:NADH:ubiquinone oxidoreductase subunit E
MNEKQCCCEFDGNDARLSKVKEVAKLHKDFKGGLIPVLHEIQIMFGYLPELALEIVSEELEIPMSEIYGVSTFYSQFTLQPKGENIIRVCMGTACYVKGAQNIVDRLSDILQTKVGNTTSDGKFTLETTRCLGGCGLAPVMMIGDKVYGRLIPDDIVRIIEEFR